MFTLFFGGDDWAPILRIPLADHSAPAYAFPDIETQHVGIGTFLQRSLIAAFAKLADRLADCPAVVGFEGMNEPHPGYLGLPSFHCWNENTDLHYQHVPSALQGMALGAGYPQRIPFYERSFPVPTRLARHVLIEPQTTAWAEGRSCIWRDHRVWEWDESKQAAIVLQNSYFQFNPRTGKPFEFYTDAWFPFIKALEIG